MANYYSSTIQKGSKGNDVTNWQKFLQGQGYYNGTIDGDYGSVTEAATKAYQQANGLVVDGIVGDKTWGKAGYSSASSSSTSAPNIGNAPSQPTFNTTATAKPNVGTAPTAPTFNTTATDKPNTDTTSWDDTTKGQAALGEYNTAKENLNKYGDFTYEDYMESDAVKGASDALNAHNANKPGEYQSQWQSQLDELMNSIMNRDKFSYNMNEDALYQQYKDNYIQQGKLAMADTMGQAAAMTGGYGSSYAQSVGQQAYQGQLNNLNDIVPELYQMALDKYNQEGQDLYNQYGMVMDRENTDYGRYRDTVSDFLTERDYLQGRYDTERGFDYGKYVDDRNMDYSLHQDGYQKLLDSLGIAQSDYYSGGDVYRTEQSIKNDEAWKDYQATEEARQYANSLLQQGYQNEFGAWEANANNMWKEYQADEDARQYANSLLQQGYQNEFGEWEANSNNAWKEAEWDESIRRYTNEEGKQTLSPENPTKTPQKGATYDNGSVSTENIKKLQEALGVSADGQWGSKSKAAANGMTADEAWAAYQAGTLGQKEPETVQPTESENTTAFINSHISASEFMQRGGTSKTPSLQGGGGRSYAEYKQYIAAELEKNWGMWSDAEKAYLIEYYKL